MPEQKITKHSVQKEKKCFIRVAAWGLTQTDPFIAYQKYML